MMGAGLKNAYAGSAIQAGYTKIGTYTGDGNATQVIGLPFAADTVQVWQTDTGSGTFVAFKHKDMGGFCVGILDTATPEVQKLTDISAIGATSFTVMTGNGFNVLGVTYYYMAQQGGQFP